jgi:hypothetical protein
MNLTVNGTFEKNSYFLDHFLENLKEGDLTFDSQDLLKFGIKNSRQLEVAIEKARHTFSRAGIDLSWHFRAYYIDIHGELLHAWKLSKKAFVLTFLKADAIEETTAVLQQKIADKVSNLFFLD